MNYTEALLRRWCNLLHASLTSVIPLAVQEAQARKSAR